MAQNEHTLKLGIDLSEILSDTDRALRELERKYEAAAKRMRFAAKTNTEIRGQYQEQVSGAIREQTEGRTLTPAELRRIKRFETGAQTIGRKVTPDAKERQMAKGREDAYQERIAEIRRSIKREQALKPHEDEIARRTAEAARLKARRVAIEKQVLAAANISRKNEVTGAAVAASDLKNAPRYRIEGQTRADEELYGAKRTDAYLNARAKNEQELARLSAKERLSKENRVRLEQAQYARLKTRSMHEAEATSAVAQERARLERRLRIAGASLGLAQTDLRIDQDILRLKAATRNAEAEVLRRTKEAAASVQQFGPAQNTTRFQRFQARQTGGDPSQQQTLGRFMGARAMSSAGFALSGLGIYGAIQAVRDLITESSELEVQFSLIESMWSSMGAQSMTGAIGSFRELKEEVLGISLATATAADTTASITRQLAGAFAVDGVPDFDRALSEAEDALKIGRTVGLPEQEITDSLTAVSLAFREQGVTFEQVGDLLVGLENQYGVLGTELIQFTADLAPLGAELGFTAEQLTALGAVAQQSSGRSGAVIAEQLGRIIPALADQSTAVLELFMSNSATAGSVNQLAEAFGASDLPGVLSTIAGNFDNFTASQQNALASMVGGRREAAVLFSILNDGEKTVKALGDTDFEDFAGGLDDRFEEISSNVQFKLDELRRTFEEFGLALFDAGLADGIIAVATALSTLFKALNPLLGLFTSFNEALEGIPVQLALIAGGMKILSALSGRKSKFGGLTSTAGAMTGIGARAMYARDATRTAARGMVTNPLQTSRAGASALAGKAFPAAAGLARGVARMAPVFLAFEALNGFMENTQKQAEEAARKADETRAALDAAAAEGPEALERERSSLRTRMESERGSVQTSLLGGVPVIGKAANYVGGWAANVTGLKDGDSALRAAAGQDQDWQVTEQALARSLAEEHQEALNIVMENSSAGFIEALRRGADLAQITANINENKGYKSEALKELIGDDNHLEFSDFTPESIAAIMESALGGNMLDATIIKQLSEFAGSSSNDDLLAAARDMAELEGTSTELPSIDLITDQLERGEITTAEYVDKAIAIGNKWREMALATEEGEAKTAELLGKAEAAFRDAADAAAAMFTEDTDLEDFLTEITNPDQDPADRAKNLANRLRQGRAAGVSNENLADTAKDLVRAEQEAFQARIDATEDVEEQLRMAEEGTPLSRTAIAALGRVRAVTGTAGQQLTVIAKDMGKTVDEITDIMVQAYVDHGDSAVESLRRIAEAQFEMKRSEAIEAYKVRTASGLSKRAIESAEGVLAEAISEAAAQRDSALSAIGNVPEFFTDPGPIGGTVGGSEADREEARRNAEKEKELAALDVAAARAGDDAVALARIATQRARVNQKYADGTAEKNQALAEVINADNALRNAVMDQAMGRELALLDLAAARAGDDAVALAQIARRRAGVASRYARNDTDRIAAQAQAVEASNQLREAQNQRAQENALSVLDIASARAGSDAVELARIAKDRAKVAERFAKTTAEKNASLAALIEADREMAASIFELFASSSAILIAQADAAMNSVASAQEQLNVLRERMSRADQLGLGQADRNQLQAEIVAQEAAVRDARLAEQREMIDYQMEIGQMTKGQAIAALQTLLTMPGLAEKQVREITLEIERMKDSIGGDFRFNLPTELALPTAYEVRRLGQSAGGIGNSGYNDNRSISVSVQVASNADPDEIANAVAAAVGDPSRNGTVERRF